MRVLVMGLSCLCALRIKSVLRNAKRTPLCLRSCSADCHNQFGILYILIMADPRTHHGFGLRHTLRRGIELDALVVV
jgi:hypothetical protein